jgi:small multidrug resistance family-3 protein
MTLAFLVLAAALEIGGDAAIRYGLVRPSQAPLLLGIVLLAAYGFAVNVNRGIDFGRLLGLYIAVFFVVSQLVGLVVFGERPPLSVLAGGALIVAGGAVMWVGR